MAKSLQFFYKYLQSSGLISLRYCSSNCICSFFINAAVVCIWGIQLSMAKSLQFFYKYLQSSGLISLRYCSSNCICSFFINAAVVCISPCSFLLKTQKLFKYDSESILFSFIRVHFLSLLCEVFGHITFCAFSRHHRKKSKITLSINRIFFFLIYVSPFTIHRLLLIISVKW